MDAKSFVLGDTRVTNLKVRGRLTQERIRKILEPFSDDAAIAIDTFQSIPPLYHIVVLEKVKQ